jgi:hypothetical protein
MPLELIRETRKWRLESPLGREAAFPEGNVRLSPKLSDPPLSFLRLRRLPCLYRVALSPSRGDYGFASAIVDTSCPITLIPRHVWKKAFRFEKGKHFEVCGIANLGERMRSQLLGSSLTCRVVRLKVPVVLAGTPHTPENLLRVERLVAQLSDTDEPKEMLLGLWGGVFEGRRLAVDHAATADDIAARFDW